MPQPSYNVYGTAITAYAISWGLLLKLGEKGILTRQEGIDSLDLALAFVEENAKHFDDRAATDSARKILEGLMRVVNEGKGWQQSSPPDSEAPRD